MYTLDVVYTFFNQNVHKPDFWVEAVYVCVLRSKTRACEAVVF